MRPFTPARDFFGHLTFHMESLCQISQSNLVLKKQDNSNNPDVLEKYMQGWVKKRAQGWVNFVPAVAYHFCLNWPAPFTRPGNSNLAQPCIRNVRYPAPRSVTRERGRVEWLARECGALLSGLAGSQSSRMPAPFAAGWVYLHWTISMGWIHETLYCL